MTVTWADIWDYAVWLRDRQGSRGYHRHRIAANSQDSIAAAMALRHRSISA